MTEKTILSFKSSQLTIRLVERDYGYPFPTYTVLKDRRVYFKSTEYCFAAKRYVSLVMDHISQLDLFHSVPLTSDYNIHTDVFCISPDAEGV